MQNTKMIDGYPYIRYKKEIFPAVETLQRSQEFYAWIDKRRTVRDFSSKPVANEVIENILLTASSAPSGAHKQPWTFCIVSNPAIKKQIRESAEIEERDSYENRMSDEWLEDLRPLGTNWEKPFLETAPFLIIIFSRSYEITESGKKRQNYYVKESTGIACGFLLAAIHHAGLVSLTHTPSPMNFLCEVLKRPQNEKPFLLIPVGYPADECWVPDLKRKELNEISVWHK